MRSFSNLFLSRAALGPWASAAPVREELFGVERLEQHAQSLSAAQPISTQSIRVLPLAARLNDNAAALLAAYRASTARIAGGENIVPAAEWLIDNYHLVEAQIREIRDDLPPGYYRQLPKLSRGPFAGYPRVFELAWAFIAHNDSHIDPEILRRFIIAFQRARPLQIGELWAVSITLRIVLVENLRRLADQIAVSLGERADADALADDLLTPGCAESALARDIATRPPGPLSEVFAAQLAKRLRDQDPRTTPALDWLRSRLEAQGASIDQVVQSALHRQGASNVTVRNVINGMRKVSDLDWADFFEKVCPVDERLRAATNFADMDFPTRNLYRGAVEVLARGSNASELEIVDAAIHAATRAASEADTETEAARLGDPGYHLFGGGRRALERVVDFTPSLRLRANRFAIAGGIGGYVGLMILVAAATVALGLQAVWRPGLPVWWMTLFSLAALLPASGVAVALVNGAITWSFGPMTLPGLELKAGIPAELRTLVVVPTLLTNESDLLEQVQSLEVYHLSSTTGDLSFALLSDGLDSELDVVDGDAALLTAVSRAIDALNVRYGPAPSGPRFMLLHRRRLYNPSEACWMGWERKRGKLHELNRLLRGATDTSFMAIDGREPWVPADVRYVLTLDADTRLTRGAAERLIGKMGHPLNRPKFSADERRVVEGFGILQPRVTPSLPLGNAGSLYRRVTSGPGGMDPYAAAVSDVYQDLFGEGSFTGKGIYDVDAFEASLDGRARDNTLLSHDLFEGIFARAGLASDVEVIEDAPSRYDVGAKRGHRWMRGDWQLFPWLFSPLSGSWLMPAVGRAKVLDNLRRSVLAPMTIVVLGTGWLLPLPAAFTISAWAIAVLALPAFLPALFAAIPARPGLRLRNQASRLADDLGLAAWQVAFEVVFLADRAWRAGDAVGRTLLRMFVTHRRLLEWTTAAQSLAAARPDLRAVYVQSSGGLGIGLATAGIAAIVAPANWPIMTPLCLLWLIAPAATLWVSRSPPAAGEHKLTDHETRALRLLARRTWRYFETHVTEADNHLPPDNFQETPKPAVAHRTSPTNIGLYLLSAVAARDFGWASTTQTVERLEATFATMARLGRFNGHFFNWYATEDLRVLDPPYVSTVDSGNLAGHLICLANACEDWVNEPIAPHALRGIGDALRLAAESLPPTRSPPVARMADLFGEIELALESPSATEPLSPTLGRLAQKAAGVARDLLPAVPNEAALDLVHWTQALADGLAEHLRDVAGPGLSDRLTKLARTARVTAMAMDFSFLLDPERRLLSIGFSPDENRLDASCYDLLASEARLASLFAIAKGDAPTSHWFRLGRVPIPAASGSILISWSGSMFEYLMPPLVMRAPVGSLLEETSRRVVERQQAFARSKGAPWGVSESAYNARDAEFTYQYSNFGVPGLGLKRGLADNLVVAPYATALATMVDAQGAYANLDRLRLMGALGLYGFYEALDFTPSRLPAHEPFAIVRAYMAHHQGMTIVAIANTLDQGRMRERFHREPIIQATELLLSERMPRDVAAFPARAEEPNAMAAGATEAANSVRRVKPSRVGPPITHLLSNGRYTVMLTASGTGYSHWRDVAITRWRGDVTRDDHGSFIMLRDIGSGAQWSAGAHPIGDEPDDDGVVFAEDHARFTHRAGPLTTTTEVIVSSEDDCEVRRVSLTNRGRRPREIELTSYAEIVLMAAAADAAHPAFAKLFVHTEYLADFDALIATRRPRSPRDPSIWAAHFAVVEGEIAAPSQHETDRARFLGRGRGLGQSVAMREGRPLSGTVGTVLDPIFSVRRRVLVAPGEIGRVAFWTLVAGSRAELLVLIDKHRDRSAFERAKTLAWTQAQVQLRYLDVQPQEAGDFQRLAAPILYADSNFRAPSDAIVRGAGPQSGLWPHAISGDLPIILLRIDEIEDIAQVDQLLRVHEYWRLKRLDVDLVIINERASSYVQDLQIAIEAAVRTRASRRSGGEGSGLGRIYALRADLMSIEARALLRSVARVALIARRGPIADQLARPPEPRLATAIRAAVLSRLARLRREAQPPPRAEPAPTPSDLEFFNGLGGFADDGREYVTILRAGQTTPAPWINVVANPRFGFQASADGSGFTWARNSRENQLTPWSNDPVSDPAGEAIYVRDEISGAVWTPTAQPIRDQGVYIARHGFGYCRFEHQANGVALELTQFVPVDDPIKISRLTLRNVSGQPRRLSVTAYADWVLGTSRAASGPFIITEIDELTGAMLARNPWSLAFGDGVAFSDLAGQHTYFTGDRTEFLGRHGAPSAPAALKAGARALSGKSGAGLDPCAALGRVIELGAGETVEVEWFFGQCESLKAAQDLIQRYRVIDLDAAFRDVVAHWAGLLGAVRVKTPDRANDIMLNGWLLYQTLACRVWARSAFYQASGAYGFRDQLQDGMALTFAKPDETRAHLLRAAARQFVQGDVQHWWLPGSGQGIRSAISDDRVWLAFATDSYIASSGDGAILDEIVPFLDGPPLRAGEADAFFQPMIADEVGTLFEHCARGLDQSLDLTGAMGLPLMGGGDWNDGMNRVGDGGRGESVWLGWLLVATLDRFAPYARDRDPARAERWRLHALQTRAALEREAWDGEWYRRATFDDGAWLGSKRSKACQIDSIAQSWAVLSGAGDPVRAARAMRSLRERLIRPDEGLALLLTPPFDEASRDPGYIKAYPPGVRENGGQYSHAAMWAVLAFARLGEAAAAADLFALLNPINHARTLFEVERYRVEPYVLAADVYSVAPHVGRGGWTWYTGAAAWMYRAGIEGILGIRREAGFISVRPCIPSAWPGFEATIMAGGARHVIEVVRSASSPSAMLDGSPMEWLDGGARVPLDGTAHHLVLAL